MKKLTLTFCALTALFAVAPAIYADGPESVSSKEKNVMQPAPPVCDLYRAHEWDLDIWGAFAFAADTGQFDVPNDDPFTPDQDVTNVSINTLPLRVVVTEPRLFNPNERVNIGQVSKNELFARDNTWGGGVDIKYFWSRYFGIGVEGVGLAAKTNFAGGGLLTLTARYPFGRFAPYVTGGIGFIEGGATLYKYFNEKSLQTGNSTQPGNNIDGTEREYWTVDPVYNNHARALGQIGAGLEFRLTCHIGLMADFTWNFVFGQEDHPDTIQVITEQGTSSLIIDGTVVASSVVTNTALNLKPGHGSDNQDFGMARVGLTFSY
jgi:opacity protein-like surface antigen